MLYPPLNDAKAFKWQVENSALTGNGDYGGMSDTVEREYGEFLFCIYRFGDI